MAKFKKEIFVIEQEGNWEDKKWFEVYTDKNLIPEEIEDVAIYELRTVKKQVVTRKLE